MAEVIRKPGISEQTLYRWKANYAGLEVDQVQQMAQLQEENLAMPPSQAANLRCWTPWCDADFAESCIMCGTEAS